MGRGALLPVLLAWVACAGEADEAHLDAPPDGRPGTSASRRPEQSFDDAVAENRDALDRGKADGTSIAYDRQVLVTQVDTSTLPRWTAAQLSQGFRIARDNRFMTGVEPYELARRPSFLYPDDGCFARARAMDYELEGTGFARPASVFSFGNLTVATSNHPWGQVGWWYHVAPIVSVSGVAYVLDPSLEPRGPLTLLQWVALQGDPAEVGVSICSGWSFFPEAACDQAADVETGSAVVSDQYWYLIDEWNRQLELGRQPWSVLGDQPPWSVVH